MTFPRYDDLPLLGDLGIRHAWEVLPAGQGAWSFCDNDATRHASTLVATGETIGLNLALDAFDPPLFGRAQVVHRVFEVGRNEVEDALDDFNPQASSQLDGLAHVRAREHGFFTGTTSVEEAQDRLGMQHWAARGLATRGVLLDVERHRRRAGLPADPFLGGPIEASELREVATAEGIELRSGDALLVRTGWAAAWMAARGTGPTGSWTGLSGGDEIARLLWDSRVCLVGSDNPAVECAPGDRAVGSLHRRLIPGLGMPLMELLDLERLAVRCAEEGRWEFLFTCAPLAIRGGVSSPANALAIL